MLHFSRWKIIAIVVACLVGFVVARLVKSGLASDNDEEDDDA